MNSKPEYRSDIDGLRGVAVLAVVLFHLGFARFKGGYVGVDVFFVISGYLITRIIASEIRAGRFSVAGFYGRRIRRIFPALFAMLAACLIAGHLLLLPGDYASFGRSAMYAALSLANIFFLNNTGYFDSATELMPLLHTWSLAIEEQFYVVWPIILSVILGRRMRTGWIVAALLAIILISLGLCIAGVRTDQKATFYLLPTRAWELAVGGLVVFLPALRLQRMVAEALPLIGLGMIAMAILAFSRQTPYPGQNALLPVLGAALIVHPAAADSFAAKSLSAWPVWAAGQISYSLYLWHWPLIVFYRYANQGASPTSRQAAALFVVSLAAAWGSWRWIERPFRTGGFAIRTTLKLGAAAAAMAALLGFVIVNENGFPDRIPEDIAALRSSEFMWKWDCPHAERIGRLYPVCGIGASWSTASVRAVAWGDSHIQHYLPLLDVAARDLDYAIVQMGACPPYIDEQGVKWSTAEPAYHATCTKDRARVMEIIRESNVNLVILAARWSAYLPYLYRASGDQLSVADGLRLLREGLDELIEQIAAPDRRILLLGEVPDFDFDPILCVVAQARGRTCDREIGYLPRALPDSPEALANDALKMIASRHEHVTLYLPTDAMCDRTRCMTYFQNEFIYRDSNHLRRNFGAEFKHDFVDLLNLRQALAAGADERLLHREQGKALGP